MLKKLTDPGFIVPAIIAGLLAIAIANNVSFVRNIVGGTA